jgi:hypothetical protein
VFCIKLLGKILQTGVTSAIPVRSFSDASSAIELPEAVNQFFYIGNDGAASVSGYRLDAATGGLTAISGSPFSAGSQPDFIAIL